MTFLPDVNLWLAFASDQHTHHATAKAWFNQNQSSAICFCRITELGLLRLLTNKHVMGTGVLSARGAREIYETFLDDERVHFVEEGPTFAGVWRTAITQIHDNANAWTDAYLAVFAYHLNATVVTFDKKFKDIHGASILMLANSIS